MGSYLEQLTTLPWQQFDNYRSMPDMGMLASDYVDVKGTATTVLSYLNRDCTIDKVNYHTKPGDVSKLYNLNLDMDDFRWEKNITVTLKDVQSYKITLQIDFDDYIVGYDYNADATPETLCIVFTPQGKMSDKKDEICEVVRNLLQSNGYEQLSEEKKDYGTSFYYSKTVGGVKFNAGLHNNSTNISFAIGIAK